MTGSPWPDPGREDLFYRLLPALYRVRDLRLGQPLRALLQALQGQYDVISANLGQSYEDWFIATCAEWVVPYLGDLVDVPRLDVPHLWPSWRGLVANTLAWRRRKGTAATLGHAVQGAGGWPAVAVVYQERLAVTQSLLDVRPGRGGTAELRDAAALASLGTPFDVLPHTVRVTSGPPGGGLPEGGETHREIPGGAFNLHLAGLSVWRLQSYPAALASPGEKAPCRYTFHPLGVDAPLFNLPVTPADPSLPPGWRDLPLPLTRARLRELLAAPSAPGQPGPAGSAPPAPVEIELGSWQLPPGRIWVADLADWPPPPRGFLAAVDPELGRLTLDHPGQEVRVSFAWGFSGDLGGGPYVRPGDGAPAAGAWVGRVDPPCRGAPPAHDGAAGFATLEAALAAWRASGESGRIEIVDDAIYQAATGSGWQVALCGSRQLTIAAAEGAFPCLRGDLRVESDGSQVGLALEGLRVDGQVLLDGYAALGIRDCTLRPPLTPPCREAATGPPDLAPPCLVATAKAAGAVVELTRCLAGPLRLDPLVQRLLVTSCLVDAGVGLAIGPPDHLAGAAAPPLAIATSTVLGRVAVQQLSATTVIFVEPVLVLGREAGGVSWSYVAPGSATPRRTRCQPDQALAESGAPARRRRQLLRLRPVFTSTVYGQPGYGQLGVHCAPELLTGTANGAEMGVFHGLWQPQRRAALAATLAEYLPWNLDASVTYET